MGAQLWVIFMRVSAINTTISFKSRLRALTAGFSFDQCPAPFAGPHRYQNLRNAAATPDKPLFHPLTGSFS